MLETLWRTHLEEITRLSLEALPPYADDQEGGSGAEDLRVVAQLTASARVQLDQIEAALRRLDDGKYGICAHCEAPIPPERLEILPAAKHCVPCQAHQDRSRR